MVAPLSRLLVCVGLALGMTFALAPPAAAGWQENVRYYRQGSVCKSDGTNVIIGASVFQKELGKKGVRQMRVKFLLYDVSPDTPGIKWAKRSKTKYSARFPNDAKNYWWDGKGGATQTWTVSGESGEWWMVAKLTWDRPNRPDWNTKIPVAYCAWSPEG